MSFVCYTTECLCPLEKEDILTALLCEFTFYLPVTSKKEGEKNKAI